MTPRPGEVLQPNKVRTSPTTSPDLLSWSLTGEAENPEIGTVRKRSTARRRHKIYRPCKEGAPQHFKRPQNSRQSPLARTVLRAERKREPARPATPRLPPPCMPCSDQTSKLNYPAGPLPAVLAAPCSG